MVKINLESEKQVNQLVTLLKNVDHAFYVSVTFGWKSNRPFLERFIEGVTRTRISVLEIDGITLESHSLDHKEYRADIVATLTGHPGSRFNYSHLVRLLNFPRPDEQLIYSDYCTLFSRNKFLQTSSYWTAGI